MTSRQYTVSQSVWNIKAIQWKNLPAEQRRSLVAKNGGNLKVVVPSQRNSKFSTVYTLHKDGSITSASVCNCKDFRRNDDGVCRYSDDMVRANFGGNEKSLKNDPYWKLHEEHLKKLRERETANPELEIAIQEDPYWATEENYWDMVNSSLK